MDVKGIVEGVSIKKNGNFGIKVGDAWYNGTGVAPNKGDEVSGIFEVKNGWNVLENLSVVEKMKSDNVEIKVNNYQKEIIRQSSLKVAVEYMKVAMSVEDVNPSDMGIDRLLKIAEKIEDWVVR